VKKRLSLKKVTIRDLDESVLQELAGGTQEPPYTSNTCSNSSTCASTCYCATQSAWGCQNTSGGSCTSGSSTCGGIETDMSQTCNCTGRQTCNYC
jgi:hypothetical protein